MSVTMKGCGHCICLSEEGVASVFVLMKEECPLCVLQYKGRGLYIYISVSVKGGGALVTVCHNNECVLSVNFSFKCVLGIYRFQT